VRKATCTGPQCYSCNGATTTFATIVPSAFAVAVGGQTQLKSTVQWNTGTQYDLTSISTWSSSKTSVATVQAGLVKGVGAGSLTASANATTYVYAQQVCSYNGNACPENPIDGSGGGTVASLSCTSPVTRGGSATCTATGASGSTFSNWKFTDGNGKTVTGSGTSSTWSGVMVIGGTVSVTVTSSGATSPLTAAISVNNRTSSFTFTAVNATQAPGNSITCYGKSPVTLPSPPVANSEEGYSCADMAYRFNYATVNDNGPNNGYEYVTSASDVNGSSPTQFQFIVVTDVLSATTFYNAQCGNFSSSNSSGFIAGSQLRQNVFDHEQGPVVSHWTEYVSAQNDSSNNIGTVLESTTAPPGSTGNSFAQTAGDAALSRISAAVEVEPCNGLVTQDSSQSCGGCGTINYSPYQACSGNPVPYCQ
jgi:hypothetical protein